MSTQKVGFKNIEKNDMTDLFKMVYGQPYLSLSVEHTAQVAPSHCKVGLSLNGFQVTSLQWVYNKNHRKGGEVEWERYSL